MLNFDNKSSVKIHENENKKDIFFCSKCSKEYLTVKNLKNHEEKCIGVDILTCRKCMFHFSSKQSKSNHIRKNNCKAKSIIHAKTPNIQNINNNKTINNNSKTINNNINDNSTKIINNINDNSTKTINIICNYGNERLDYLSHDDMIKILTSGDNSVPLYIEKTHFNKDFPENHNIQYDKKSKKCKIKDNNIWKKISMSLISSKLLCDNSDKLLSYYKNNKIIIEEKIMNDELIEFVVEKLLLLRYRRDKEKYNNIIVKIKNLLEDNSFI